MGTPYEMLLYPELLTNEQLIIIIQERCLRIDNVEKMDRCELIELFKNYCVPYGQRKYRDSGRGKVLNKTRKSPDVSPNAKLNIMNSRKIHLNNERLKPPPDVLSYPLKRIRIDVEDKNCKRKMSVDSVNSSIDSPPAKRDRKPITWP